jgi:glycosyltransferase involved in cell wall biosynthesis
VRISVVTPSYRNSNWLKLCLASVADQGGDVEHIVQDAGSDDGTLDWLRHDKRVTVFVEKDQGMYDAINRGLKRSTGEILAYLNCDEQYLPGALQAVRNFFQENPRIDVAFGDFVVVDTQGDYLFHRKIQVPLKHHTWVCHLATFTCATFFRRKIIDEYGLLFDARLRIVGDGEWMLRLLKRQVTMAVLRHFTSTFTLTGTNLGTLPSAHREAQELFRSAPFWARKLKWSIILHHRIRRLAGGMYSQKPFDYAIYTQQSPDRRVVHDVVRPTSRWKE